MSSFSFPLASSDCVRGAHFITHQSGIFALYYVLRFVHNLLLGEKCIDDYDQELLKCDSSNGLTSLNALQKVPSLV